MRDRSTHTGTQAASTISDFANAVDSNNFPRVLFDANAAVPITAHNNPYSLEIGNAYTDANAPSGHGVFLRIQGMSGHTDAMLFIDSGGGLYSKTTFYGESAWPRAWRQFAYLDDTTTALSNRVRVDAVQSFSAPQQFQARSNIGLDSVDNVSAANLRDRNTHTGTQSADTLTDGSTNKAFLGTERTKLAGVATGATANDTDANLKARANHTGTQLAATISDFAQAVRDTVLTGLPAAIEVTSLSNDGVAGHAARRFIDQLA